MKTLSGAIAALVLFAVAFLIDTAILPRFFQPSAASMRGFLSGADWVEHLSMAGGGLPAYLHVTTGIWVSAMLAFLLGRFVMKPVFELLPKISPPDKSNGLRRVLDFIMPPPPPKTIRGRPAFEVIGIPLAAFVHLLPPTGPWAVRVVIDAFLGLTGIPIWQYAVGAYIGILAHLAAVSTIAAYALPVPTPPGGLLGLVAFFAPPIIITTLVRSILALARSGRAER